MISISVYRRYAQPQWYYRQTSRQGSGPQRAPRPQQGTPGPQKPPEQQEPPERPPQKPPRTESQTPRSESRPHCSEPQTPRQSGKKSLVQILEDILPEGLDSGDLFLVAMLLFLYSESRDEDFLIILIVVGLSIFHKDREDK